MAALGACGGSNNDGGSPGNGSSGSSSGGGGSLPATASNEGLFTGSFRSTVTGTSQNGVMLVLATGEAHIIENNCVQVVALTTMSGNNYIGSGNAYAPDGGFSSCPAITFPNKSSMSTASISGQAVTNQSLIGSYSAGGDSGSYTLAYNVAYGRTGTLSRLVGLFSNGTMQLQIAADGTLSGNLGSQQIVGYFSTIDPTKNAYRISITEGYRSDGVTPASGAAATAPIPASGTIVATGDTWNGVAFLTDFASSTDNYLQVSLTNPKTGFAAQLIKQ